MKEELSTEWIWIPAALCEDETVSATEVVIYSVLLDHADESLKVKISQKQIAEEVGVSRNTVQKALKRLEKGNLLQKIEPPRKGGELTYHLREIAPRMPKKNKKKPMIEMHRRSENNFDD